MGRDQDGKNAQKQQSEISRLRKQLKEKELKGVPNYKLDTSAQRAAILRPDDKSRVEEGADELKRQVDQKNQAINERDRTIEQLRLQLNVLNFYINILTSDKEKMSYDMKEKQTHTGEVLKLKEQYAELDAKYRALAGGKGNDERKKTGDISVSKESEIPEKGKKLKRISYEDVKFGGNAIIIWSLY